MIIIKDEQDRSVLGEGRNFGFGFSILNKEENTYNTLMPFTACKDYLNDFVYVEQTKLPLGKIHGFQHEYTGILQDTDHFYLGIKAVHYKSSSKWDRFDELTELINTNSNNLVKFINKMEEVFNLDTYTTIEILQDNTLILKSPIFWTKYSFLISLYTLYIRCFINVTEEELNKDIKELLVKERLPFLKEDGMLFVTSLKFIEEEIFNKLLDYKYPNQPSANLIHNLGINGRLSQITTKLKK